MHVLVIGGTGPSGIVFIDAALKAGHQLTIYARSPHKLSWEVLNDQKVKVVEGTFQDDESIKQAVNGGAEALVSCAGPMVSNRKGTPIADFYAKIYKLIQSEPDCRIRRCLILSTPSYLSSKDVGALKWKGIVLFISTFANFAYKEIITLSELTAKQPADKLGWTLFRVPLLTNSAPRTVHAGYTGDGTDGLMLSRKSLAVWLVSELESKKWIGQAPLLSDSSWI